MTGATRPQATLFRLFTWNIGLVPALYDAILAVDPAAGDDRGPVEAAAHITRTLHDLAEEGFDLDDLGTWTAVAQTRLVTVLHLATFSGVLQYPPAPATPEGAHDG